MSRPDPHRLSQGVRGGDRRALARAITLVESGRADDQERAATLMAELLPHTGGASRLGVTGPPGAGKSTFIEALGTHLIAEGHRLAVLAIDPSSARSGGSILGDKTRMTELGRRDEAFIRPSPAGGALGGVARRTREAMLVCEAAGFDVVVIETVGVGQSEMAVADMVDLFVLLLAPGGGDELQGLKRGIVERAEVVVVNKADGELKGAAQHVAASYQAALTLLRPLSPHWTPRVVLCSALTGEGVPEVWQTIEDHRMALEPAGEIAARRAVQAKGWMWDEVSESLLTRLKSDPATAALVSDFEGQVGRGELSPAAAAHALLKAFRKGG